MFRLFGGYSYYAPLLPRRSERNGAGFHLSVLPTRGAYAALSDLDWTLLAGFQALPHLFFPYEMSYISD